MSEQIQESPDQLRSYVELAGNRIDILEIAAVSLGEGLIAEAVYAYLLVLRAHYLSAVQKLAKVTADAVDREVQEAEFPRNVTPTPIAETALAVAEDERE